MASHDAGAQVTCPGCGQVVLQKAMIPVLGDGGQGVRYLCQACARALIVRPTVPGDDREPVGEPGADPVGEPGDDREPVGEPGADPVGEAG